MAATESASTATSSKTSTTPTKSIQKPEKLAKVEKPDDGKFKNDLAEADKQLNIITEKMVSSPSMIWETTINLAN